MSTSAGGAPRVPTGRGAFAMLDALGFKGIWERHPRERVIAKLTSLRERFDADVRKMLSRKATELVDRRALPDDYFIDAVTIAFLSDTIVIGVPTRTTRPDHGPSVRASDCASLAIAGSYVSLALRLALDEEPRLAYRGAIAVGEFSVDADERFIVGPAVDEAAERHEQSDAAIVWLAPSARQIWGSNVVSSQAIHRVFPYEVPLKRGATERTFAVSPFEAHPSDTWAAEIRANLLATFDGARVDVSNKKRNTERFLDEARRSAP